MLLLALQDGSRRWSLCLSLTLLSVPRSGVGIGRVSILPCCEGRCPNVQLYLSWDVTAQGSHRPRRSIGIQVEKRPAPTPKGPSFLTENLLKMISPHHRSKVRHLKPISKFFHFNYFSHHFSHHFSPSRSPDSAISRDSAPALSPSMSIVFYR